MWERNLQALVRGLRAHQSDEAKFIARSIDEIKREIKSKDMELKASAVAKLTYVGSRRFSNALSMKLGSFACSSTCWATTWVGPPSMSWKSCLPPVYI